MSPLIAASSIHVHPGQVAAALVLVVIAAIASRSWHAGLEEDIGIAVLRSFIQLTAIGYVITVIFDQDSALLAIALIVVMVTFGAFTARHRAKGVPNAFWPLLFPLGVSAAAPRGLVVALGISPATPRYLVPVGGMVIGNSMTAAAVALNRLGEDVADSAGRIEATLALGATSAEAGRPGARRRLQSRVVPLIGSAQTNRLIFFPGTMVGMLLAGAAPVDAVRLQLVLLYVLLGGTSIAALVAVLLAYRAFFTPAQQLRDVASE